jgi:hypothetical protein
MNDLYTLRVHFIGTKARTAKKGHKYRIKYIPAGLQLIFSQGVPEIDKCMF